MPTTRGTATKHQATTGEAIEKAAGNVRMALRRMDDSADADMVKRLKRINLDLAELVVGFQRAELDAS